MSEPSIPSPPPRIPVPYIFAKRAIRLAGPVDTPISTHDGFQAAWSHALSEFEGMGFTIVGCHLEPEFPHHAAYAEFFVTAGTYHRTYVIHRAE